VTTTKSNMSFTRCM